MKHFRIILVGLSLSLFAGCYSAQEKELVAFSRLKSGMTEGELKKIMGEPKKIEPKGEYVLWTYPDGTVIMKEGLVFSWEIGDIRP